MVRDLAAAAPPGVRAREGLLVALPRGKSAINRAATVAESGCADGLSGSAAINEAILSVAVSLGIRVRLAASSQGSTSNLASAERTLRNIPFLSSPIGANRKSSNSDVGRATEAERVISITEFFLLLSTAQGRQRSKGRWGIDHNPTLLYVGAPS
jgi:hypothetical protein